MSESHLPTNNRVEWALKQLGNAVGARWAALYEHDEWLSVVQRYVEKLRERIADCELSLRVYDHGGTSEYWLRHESLSAPERGERVTDSSGPSVRGIQSEEPLSSARGGSADDSPERRDAAGRESAPEAGNRKSSDASLGKGAPGQLPSKEQLDRDWTAARAAWPKHHTRRLFIGCDTDNSWMAGYRAALADLRAAPSPPALLSKDELIRMLRQHGAAQAGPNEFDAAADTLLGLSPATGADEVLTEARDFIAEQNDGFSLVRQLVERIARLQQLLGMRPPYYCQNCDCASCGNTRPRPSNEPRQLPEVGGEMLPTTLAQFEQRCKVQLADEQRKPNPDNALIGLLCDAVRLARENESMAKAGITLPPELLREIRLAHSQIQHLNHPGSRDDPPPCQCRYCVTDPTAKQGTKP
jgi:hypothetical protein